MIAPKVFVYRLSQDDPRKNTAIKLSKHGFIRLVGSPGEVTERFIAAGSNIEASPNAGGC